MFDTCEMRRFNRALDYRIEGHKNECITGVSFQEV